MVVSESDTDCAEVCTRWFSAIVRGGLQSQQPFLFMLPCIVKAAPETFESLITIVFVIPSFCTDAQRHLEH